MKRRSQNKQLLHFKNAPLLISTTFTFQKLDDVMKIELIADKSAEEISELWKAHYVEKACSLCAVIPSATFLKMKQLFDVHKTFLLPLPRASFIRESKFSSMYNYLCQRLQPSIFCSIID